MRINNAASGRIAPYDRNPTPKNFTYFNAGLAPHSNTNRITYTVPSARKAICEMLFGLLERITAAAPAAEAKIAHNYQPSGGSISDTAVCSNSSNTVGAIDRVTVANGMVFFAGDVINCSTQDGSTGGTNEYDLTAKLTEFDA